jgi:cell division protein FtsL
VATLLFVLLLSALYPVRQYFAQAAKLRHLAAQERELDAKITALNRTRDALLTDAEVERIAREDLGMVRPGEVAFAIVPGAKPAAKQPAAGNAPSKTAPKASGAGHGSWWSSWWGGFIDAFSSAR